MVGRLGRAAAAAGLTLMAALMAGEAAAQGICTRLEAQLAALQRGAARGDTRDTERAYRQALNQYESARQDARRMGCAGGFFRDPAPGCGRVLATLDRLEANLDRLESQRNRRTFDPRRNDTARVEVLQALADNQCGPQYERFAARPAPVRRGGLLAAILGADDWRNESLDDGFFDIPEVNTFRTLCVRTCDGYYFPISFSTLRAQFGKDEATCQAMCPGTEVALYVHRNPGGDAETMVSIAGQRYSDLPSAFAYRQAYNPSCACQFAHANFTPIDGAQPAFDPSAALRGRMPLPRGRPEPSEDPETIANRAGGFVPGPIPPPANAAVADLGGDRAIRLIGPAYYYAQ